MQSCREPFEAETKAASESVLVIEGYINIGAGPTQIKLSRTGPLSDPATFVPETGAQITVENTDGEVFPLSETTAGIYSSELNLGADKYRLNVATNNNEEYVSEFVEHMLTPPIDSVNWIQHGQGLTIYVSTHDSQNQVNYFQWEYDEAWETNSAFQSSVKYVGTDLLYRDSIEQENMYRCYKYATTPDLIIASTEKLTASIITLQQVTFIPAYIDRLSVKYSILIKQHALSKDAYRFFSILQANSNNLGSFFDRQPSQLIGNMHSTNSNKMVIGYIGAYTTQTYRLTLVNGDDIAWRNDKGCREIFVPIDSLDYYLNDNTPTSIFSDGVVENDSIPDIDGVYAALKYCVDCRLLGGTNIRPSFWDSVTPEP